MAKGIGKHLHFYRGQWRARVVVPVELRPLIGKRQLEEPLGADPKLAEKRSHAVLAGFPDKLDVARAHLAASEPTLASAGMLDRYL